MPSLRGLARSVKRRWKGLQLETPKNLFVFLTNSCHLHCEHCFYHYELAKPTVEISTADLARLAGSLSRPTFMCLTGGEVMLRRDMPEVAKVLGESGRVEHINVCTSGYHTDRIEAFARSVLDAGWFRLVGFQISLDGVEETHNTIRKNPQSFRRAVDTLEMLAKLAERYPALYLSSLMVVTRRNRGEVIGVLNDMERRRIPHSFSFLRTNQDVFHLDSAIASGFDVREPETTIGLSLEEWEETVQEIQNAKAARGYENPGALSFRTYRVQMDTLRQERRMIPCYAGTDDGVIFPNGDVAVCETTKPFANLREFDFDLGRLWNAATADEMRSRTKCCACTQACNIIDSLNANPELYGG